MRESITVNVPQGIGDIFWCYQKLAPHFERININVLCVAQSDVQQRARAFCAMLPRVGAISYEQVKAPQYAKVAASTYALSSILNSNGAAVSYACNAPLERGINLLDIDPGYAVDSFVDMVGVPYEVETEDYLCVFVSGHGTNKFVWKTSQWASAVRKVATWLGTDTIKLVGASWDTKMGDALRSSLQSKYKITSHVGQLDLAASVDVIRRARFFLGYQSGLNVIAENYNVCQLMLYFPHLREMLYTWCKPDSVKSQFFATTFADDFDAFVRELPVCSDP
jgi:hypothetical protein